MFKQNRNLFVIAVIAVVNALGYGIIIPILYSYSKRYGLTDFENGLLFSVFSVFQFLSTPVIGRLSDKYGRKPLLLISIAGTAVSFFTMAFAPSAIFLFIARALDGLTAGNIPVAAAVISDTTDAKNRARGFGIIGASFGFGFIFGPAIAAATLRFGASVPFLIAGAVAIAATILTALILPETNMHRGREVAKAKFIDLPALGRAALDENVGTTLILTLLYATSFSLFIYGFQPFAVKILRLSATQISEIFTAVGIVGLLAQTFIIPQAVRIFGDKKTLTAALLVMVATFLGFSLARSMQVFIFIAMVNALANAFVGPLAQTLLSKEVDEKSQGSILGLNSSYMSIGMILGPIVGGTLATIFVPLPFIAGSFILLFCVGLSVQILRKPLSARARLHAMS